MPLINLKIVKEQVNPDQKKKLINGLMDIVVNIMHRDKNFTVIIVDEIDASNWFIGGRPLNGNDTKHGKVASINIKISKGTSYPDEMEKVIVAGKMLVSEVLGQNEVTNYFVIEELNPDGWGFDGSTMTMKNQKES
ncbi:4-oxalocrotonate tautomerase family protein [bacterium]